MGNATLTRGTIIGTVLQVLMVVVGHYVPQVAQSFPIVGTLLGGVTGFLANQGRSGATTASAAGTGAAGGAVAGILGTLVSTGLGDVPMSTVGVSGASTAVLGAIGGLVARAMAPKK